MSEAETFVKHGFRFQVTAIPVSATVGVDVHLVARTFFSAQRATSHTPHLAQDPDGLRTLACLRNNLHNLISWLCLVSHSLPLHFALHHLHCLRLHITGFTDGSATPRACGSTGRMADNTHTPQYQELPNTRWPDVCGKDVHTVICSRTLSFWRRIMLFVKEVKVKTGP